MSRRSCLALLLVAACTGGASSTKPTTNEPVVTDGSANTGSASVTQMKKPGMPKPTVSWVKGPAVTASADELVAWFEAQKREGQPRMTRVPIVMKRGDTGFSSRGVKIGNVEVYVSDAALGIGMAMRARSCTGETCPFIVQGFWHGKEDGSYHYEIREASRHPITPEELAAFTHVEVEGESGN